MTVGNMGGDVIVLAVPVLFTIPRYFPRWRIIFGGCDEYCIRLGLASKYGIGLNTVRKGKIGVKRLLAEYG